MSIEYLAGLVKAQPAILKKMHLLLFGEMGDTVDAFQRFVLRISVNLLRMQYAGDRILLFLKPFLPELRKYMELVADKADIGEFPVFGLQIIDGRFSLLTPVMTPGKEIFDIDQGTWLKSPTDMPIPQLAITLFLMNDARAALKDSI